MKQLLQKYKQEQSSINHDLREQLILDFTPLIRFIAQKIASRLPANVEIDDLMSAGVIGLMDAIEKYDASRDNKFKTYAEFRVRGAILDELRAQDWVPRSIRDKAKKIDRVYAELEQRLGRNATDEEVAAALGVELDEYFKIVSRVRATSLLSVEESALSNQYKVNSILEVVEQTSETNPFIQLKSRNVQSTLLETIQKLPERQRLVLCLYYYEDLNLKDIGIILEVTESRVSQLHTQGIEKLRKTLEDLLVD